MSNRAIILCTVLLLAAPARAREKTDVIIMNNGDRLTGEIKGLDESNLQVSLDYVAGTISVDWSKVAHLESNQLFIVKTQGGSVYTGTLRMTTTPEGRPVQVLEVNEPKKERTIESTRVVQVTESSEKFWQRFNGGVDTGLIYSKGNEATQLNLGSEAEYVQERWSAGASFNTNLAANKNATTSTRNQLKLNRSQLLPWKNYFYQGFATFLQSSEQGIRLQTTLGGGIGRYLKNTNRATISLLGGFGWQATHYQPSAAPIGTQNVAAGLIAAQVILFKFNKTNLNLDAMFLPAISEPGRMYFNTNATYYIKLTRNLNWNISFYGDWDSRPPANFPGSNYGTSSGLSWTFGLR